MGRNRLIAVCVAVLGLAGATPAAAHIERASYWPDPRPDCTITPCTGGAVPTIRSLSSALDAKAPGTTRVVCQDDSLARLRASIRAARKDGYLVRPSERRSLSARRARQLLRINTALAKRCRYKEIQPAVTASGNNDRVVVMPGLYTEPTARKALTNDPACKPYLVTNDRGATGAVSYAYQDHCPNDQNLIAVIGRRPGTGQDPQPPLEDRHGIPNSGPCVRCNLQLEGSGVGADDVIVDAGRVASGNKGPIGAVKDVGIRADRADGFVLRNITVRHAREHAIYVLESDGYVLDHFKTYYGGEYGVLTFVEDHGLIQHCEATGSGDSGLYPGAGADTGKDRRTDVYPEFRYSQEVRFCDSHHNTSGYSGTDGNAVHVHDNRFYGNALGFTTDVFTAPGHPGFPQDSDLIEDNEFFSNNLNVYAKDSDVKPTVPVPVGTGMWVAGGNANTIRNNRFYDNYRRGVMIFSAPDALICGPTGTPVTGCDPLKISTSYGNQVHDNVMGVAPDGTAKPNGTDFWWDSFAGNTGNCWWGNRAAPGRKVTSAPTALPSCNGGRTPALSVGIGDLGNELELVGCFGGLEVGGGYNSDLCPWYHTPARPGTASAAGQVRAQAAVLTRALRDPAIRNGVCALYRSNRSLACAGTLGR